MPLVTLTGFFLVFYGSATPTGLAGCPQIRPPWQDAVWLSIKIYSPLDIPAPPDWKVADCLPSFGGYELLIRASRIANVFRGETRVPIES